MAIKYLKSSAIKNQTVLVRADFNTEIDGNGQLREDYRLQAILPTIEELRRRNCTIILCGHLGRPKGQWDKEFSVRPVAERLSAMLQLKFVATPGRLPDYNISHVVFFSGDIRKEIVLNQLARAKPKDVVVLENLRFYSGEDANDSFFAKQLSSLAQIYPRIQGTTGARVGMNGFGYSGEARIGQGRASGGVGVYVNDAFGVCHRKAASIVAVTKYLPAYAGLLLEKEIKALQFVMKSPKKPFVVMVGGIKISDKAKVLENLGQHTDSVLVGGGVANLLLLAKGMEIGQSKVEKEFKDYAWQLEKNLKHKLVLPLDFVVANQAMDKRSIRVASPYDIRKNEAIFDLGPKTILNFAGRLKLAKTIVWGGPLGYFEKKPFHTATMALARVIGAVSKGKTFSVVGGGETVNAVRLAHQEDNIDHLSTGGGAMLEFLAGQKLPGLEALK